MQIFGKNGVNNPLGYSVTRNNIKDYQNQQTPGTESFQFD